MCDIGSHAHPPYLLQLDPRENITNVCVWGCLCGCKWVCDTWRELGVALLRQVDHPGWPVLTGWYVSFSGGCWRGHTVVMPAWLMARDLSVFQSGQVHSPVQPLHGVAFKRAGFYAQWLCNTFIHCHSSIDIFFPYISNHSALCINSTIVMLLICGLITSRWCVYNQDTVFSPEWALFVDLMLCWWDTVFSKTTKQL